MRFNHPILAAVLGAGLLASVSAAEPTGQTNAAIQKETYNYVLTMDKVRKLDKASTELQAFFQTHPEAKQPGANAAGLDRTVETLQTYPEANAIVARQGLTVREYVVGIVTISQAGVSVGFRQSGRGLPPSMAAGVNPVNTDFLAAHWNEVQQLAIFQGGR